MRHEVLLPDLGLADVTVSLWLVDVDSDVTAGDRLLEVLADGVTVDIPAPASGTLVEQLVGEEDTLRTGQTLGTIEGNDE